MQHCAVRGGVEEKDFASSSVDHKGRERQVARHGNAGFPSVSDDKMPRMVRLMHIMIVMKPLKTLEMLCYRKTLL